MAVKLESFRLPAITEPWPAEQTFKTLGKPTPATQRNIEPVGMHFLGEARRKRHKRTFSEEDRYQASQRTKKIEDEDDGEISEAEDPGMLARDAKDWKQQDHYAVLGLSKYRHTATDEQIKRAHRKKVLKHHPDKRAAQGGTEDDSFFKCIQKATELLLDPVRRRQFDSVDEAADVEPPSKKETKAGNFFKLWGPVFKSEARFSRAQPVPKLGDDKSSKAAVEHFYDFWYNFDSWRTFEYLDEEVPDDSADRDQKRHVERKNFNQRKKKKTEDTARLRKLVDDALALDERIAKFKREEKAQKNRKKDEREAEAKRAAEAEKKRKEDDERLALEREAAEKAQKAEGKKAKEAAKNAVKKNKRVVRGAPKDVNYFEPAGTDASETRISSVLDDTDALLGKLDADELAELVQKLSVKKDGPYVKDIFSKEVHRLQDAGKVRDGELSSLRS